MSNNESNVVGFRKDYNIIYNDLKRLTTNFGTLDAIKFSICELPFHGYSVEEVNRERSVFENVKEKYDAFMCALKEASGIKD